MEVDPVLSVPFDVVNSDKIYTCDFGLNQEGKAIVGDITMLAYEFICSDATGNDCDCSEKEIEVIQIEEEIVTNVTEEEPLNQNTTDEEDNDMLIFMNVTIAALILICGIFLICVSRKLSLHLKKATADIEKIKLSKAEAVSSP